MSMTTIHFPPDDLQDRLVRLLIFVLMFFIILRYLSGINISDFEQIEIVVISAICLMFVNTYYPYIVLK